MNKIKTIYNFLQNKYGRSKKIIEKLSIGVSDNNEDDSATINNKKNIKVNDSVDVFQKKWLNLLLDHMNHSKHKCHRTLVREIVFLTHYTFEILKDDFYLGDAVLGNRMTNLNNYVFSKYRKNPELAENIKKIITVAFSNRFSSSPNENLLAYYVFIEETDFEITKVFNDFYLLLQNRRMNNNSYFNLRNKINPNTNTNTVLTLVAENLSEIELPLVAQKKIIGEFIQKEHEFLIKKND
jgi:hypothetical protein